MEETIVRDAKIEDAERILDIYAYYIQNTAITFEYDVPTLAEFQSRIKNTIKKYPYLVIEKNGIVQGYAYAGPFVGRAACDWACEVTVYLDHSARKCGYGRLIYKELEHRLGEMGIVNLYASIAYPIAENEYLDKNSAEFHEHLGFAKAAEFHKCGYKFGYWYNLIWMEKFIGEHLDNQPPVKFQEGGTSDDKKI